MTATGYTFCTLFDRHYATRGLALYHSLERHCTRDFTFTILCIDAETRDFLTRMALPRARLLLPEDLDDPELLAVRDVRGRREFCWSCSAPLMHFMLKQAAPGEIVTYVDSDLAFFSDPQPVFDEMGTNDIAIHEHRFSPRYQSYVRTAGIFNVGLIAVRASSEGISCVERWRAQCLEKCELDPDNGYCGDQKYLEEWPTRYKRLVVLQHPGVCVAPWNIENYRLGRKGETLTVDGKPLIFYHFHGLVPLTMDFFGRCVMVPAQGYKLTGRQCRLIYKPYARQLRRVQAQADEKAPGTLQTPQLSLSSIRPIVRMIRQRTGLVWV